ncbi:MAG TPA: transcriptional repressor [Cyclobacteriaceae bacterium]|nr:transcriptional repressor [Cyclobacteriaceae bacterium]
MEAAGKQLLKEFNLRVTPSRSSILSLFLGANFALSHADLEKGLGPDADRVTVYRTLKSFLDVGLIHKVLDDSGTLKYALCNEPCSHNQHQHDHVHFKCQKCGQTNCLEDVSIPGIALPKGYEVQEMSLLIQGICHKCG